MSKTFKDKRQDKQQDKFSRKKFLENKKNKKRNTNFTSEIIEEIMDNEEKERYESTIYFEQFEDLEDINLAQQTR